MSVPGRNIVTSDSDDPSPPQDEVRAALAAILSSPAFEASPRRRDFLRFIVEETLAGRGHTLKGFTIAVGVFGRDESFDPQADPVVRLEAGRLRRDLDSYYVEAGRDDGIRIIIPKGSYLPRFERNGANSSPIPDGQSVPPIPPSDVETAPRDRSVSTRTLTIAGLLLLLSCAGGLWLAWGAGWLTRTSDQARGPAVIVLPFDAIGDTASTGNLAAGLGEELVSDLMRFPGFRLYIPPLKLDGVDGLGPSSSKRDIGAKYVVRGSVREGRGVLRIAAQLSNLQTGQVLWSGSYDRQPEPGALIQTQRDIAAEIATAIGQPYGAVNSDMLAEKTPAVSSLQSYLCVQEAYRYRRSFSRAEFEPVLACLEQTVQHDPAYSDAWAMLGWLRLDRGRFADIDDTELQKQYDLAFEAASRAVALEPDNPLALKALSSIQHYRGEYDESERLARRAAAMNPNDPDTLAQLGWRLAVRGKFDDGIPILRRAIERTTNPPGWYYHLIAVDQYLHGQYGQMLETAQRSAAGGSGISQMLIAIASAELGDRQGTQAALAEMAKSRALASDPARYISRTGAIQIIVDALVKGLAGAKSMAAGN